MKQDITDQKLSFDHMMYLAEYDQMTGLANKSQFLLKLSSAIQGDQITSGYGYLLLIDLDGFKPINDEYGHIAGDECLKEVSNRLKSINHSDNEIFRIGGDEFAIITTEIQGIKTVQKFAQRIIDCLSEPFIFEKKCRCCHVKFLWPERPEKLNVTTPFHIVRPFKSEIALALGRTNCLWAAIEFNTGSFVSKQSFSPNAEIEWLQNSRVAKKSRLGLCWRLNPTAMHVGHSGSLRCRSLPG